MTVADPRRPRPAARPRPTRPPPFPDSEGGARAGDEGPLDLRARPTLETPERGGAPSPSRRLGPSDIAAIRELAHDYLAAGLVDVARPLYRGLVDLEPREPHHWMGLALCLDGAGDPSGAAQLLMKAETLDPSDPSPLVALAEIHLVAGDVHRALGCLRRAQRAAPSGSPLVDKIDGMLELISRRPDAPSPPRSRPL